MCKRPAEEEQPDILCSAFGMFGSQMKGHQSLVRPLPSADIAEHRASYTSALLGLCLQSEPQREREREKEGREKPETTQVIITCIVWVWVTHCSLPSINENAFPFSGTLKDNFFFKSTLTSKMIPLRTSFESTPTFRSSRHSLSNFSGVSLLSMLEKWKPEEEAERAGSQYDIDFILYI